MKILVAIDGSEHSEAALDEITHRHSPPGSEVRVISVVNPPMPLAEESLATSAGYHGELEKMEREQARRAIEKAAGRLRDSLDGDSVKITTEVLSGSPKQVILEEAEAFGADLIVVGSHGHGAFERFLLGSVSQAVALHAKCSVEIVRSPRSELEMMRILVAIDGSEQSEAAVDEIVRWHYPADSEVRVISVIEPPYFPTTYPGEGVDMKLYGEMEKYAGEVARAAVEKAAAKLRADAGSRQLNVTTKVISGSPKEAILEEAEAFGADLIVVGSHGYGMLERFLLGSVSQAVALHAKCSVEIVRSPKTQTSESAW
jgi:nucleotide-binding universal stress UspA family protein